LLPLLAVVVAVARWALLVPWVVVVAQWALALVLVRALVVLALVPAPERNPG